MNKTYRVVWNESTNTWVAVSETAKAHGKSSRSGSEGAGLIALSSVGVKAAAKLTASVAALYLVGTTSAYASPGIYINDGTDPSCQAISDSTNWGGLYTIYRGEKIQYINGGYVPANVDPTLDYFNIKSTNNPCSSVGAAAQHHNTQTNRTLFYGSNGAATDADNGAKNLTLGGRLDVNSGIIGVGNQGTNGAGATYSIRMGKGSMLSAENDNSTAISIGVGDDYNRAGAKGSGSIAIGYNALAEGNNSSIAIGNSAKAGHALSLAIGTLASTADGKAGTVALGYAAKGQDENATAIGYQAEAAKGGSVLGQGSKATAEDTVALGRSSNASLQNAVALGSGSTTGTNASKVDSATVGSVTYGGGTNAFAGSAGVAAGDQVSIGSAGNERQIKHVAPGAINANSTDAINGSQLFHITQGLQGQIAAAGANGVHFYHVNGTSADNNYNNDGATGNKALAAGINAKAAGASSVAVGSAEVAAKSVVGQSNSEGAVAIGDSAYAAGRQAVTLGASRAEEEQAVAIGSNARSSGKASTAIGAAAVASKENSISIGSSANSAGNNSVAIGANSSTVAAAAGSVALGHTSQATRAAIDATKVQANAAPTVANNQVYALASASNADQNNIRATVKGELGAVSVGTQNGTRQIINVAAGTEDSDAVNVAQLKAVANQITTQAVATTPLTVANDGKVTPPAAADAGKLATAGDIAKAINNSGFKATAGGNTTGAAPTQELIKAGDTLTLKAGSGLTVEQSGSTFTYALNAQQITQNAQTPVVYTKADGSKVYKHTDGNFYDQPNGAGTQVAAGDVIASMNAGDNTTSTPTTLANVKSNLADAANAAANPANNSRANFAGKGNNAATVNDVLNAGFNVQGNGDAKDFVTHGDTINFVNGQGTVAKVISTNGKTDVTFDTPLSYADAAGNNTTTPSNAVNLVGSDPSKPVTLGNVAEGVKDTDAVNVAQLNAAKTKVQAADNSPVTVTGTGSSTDPYKVGVNTVTLTAPATGTDAGKVTVPTGADAGKLVTAGDIANAINNSGFKATAGGNTTGAAPTQELIKAGDTLTLKAGSGLTVEQSGSTFTYALNAQQITQNAQTPVVYTKADGSKVYKHTDGNFYDQPNGAGTQVAAGDVIASMQGADGATTATPATKDPDTGIMTMAGGTTLNNVASAGDITNPANAYRAVNAGDLNNSVQKLVNNGFKIDADNGTVDTVKLGETVKYAGDSNIITTVSNNQIGFKLANTVTIGSRTGSNPVKIDGTAGTVTGLTNKTWNPAAITSGRAATEDQLKAVADAANSAGAGFTIAGNSKAAGVTTADETIKAGETLSIKGTGTGTFADYDSSNIQTQVGANGEVTVGLKKDLNVNSVTAGNTKVDNGGITITNPADPSKNVSLTGNGLNNGGNKITNVGDGVADTDAVNVRQLKAAQTNVNNLTNNVIGTNRPNLTTYDVYGNVADNQNSVVDAINKMNTGGIKFFHVNDGTGTQSTAGTLSHPEDSAAKGAYGAAVGYQAKADGENSVALGKGAEATGKNSISIGTGNIVTGIGSGAIGDPTTITGNGTFSVGNNNGTISVNNAGVFGNQNTLAGESSRIVGNNNTVTAANTFVVGNNSTNNVANSVVLGSNASANAAATASSAGTTTYASSVINGTTYNYAGATPTGVVSVGNVGAERRVQNVAAGLISADSTDAINGSQLYATNSAINALQTGGAGIVQYSNGNAQPNGGTPTNHVTMVGADQNAPVTVHNVAAGVAPTDAVNVSQLQGVAGQIGKVADEADAGTAAAMAAAGLPQAYLPGKSMVAVSGSTYRGKQGYAVGFSAINDGGNWIVKGIATGNSKGKFGATIGAGYQW